MSFISFKCNEFSGAELRVQHLVAKSTFVDVPQANESANPALLGGYPGFRKAPGILAVYRDNLVCRFGCQKV